MDQVDEREDSNAPVIPHSEPAGGTGSLEAAMMTERNPIKRFFKVVPPLASIVRNIGASVTDPDIE